MDEDDIEIVNEEDNKAVSSFYVAVALEEEEKVAVTAESASALETYAEKLLENYGLKVTITQSPSGGSAIKAGGSVTWYVTNHYSDSGFSAYNKTLWDSYDDLNVTKTKKMTIEFTKVQGNDFDADNPTTSTTLEDAVLEMYSANDVDDDTALFYGIQSSGSTSSTISSRKDYGGVVILGLLIVL